MPERAATLEVIDLIMFAPLLYSMVELRFLGSTQPGRPRQREIALVLSVHRANVWLPPAGRHNFSAH
jgi:hypothetical protein